jgi:thiol-disulfide isomerase/thioredoxin
MNISSKQFGLLLAVLLAVPVGIVAAAQSSQAGLVLRSASGSEELRESDLGRGSSLVVLWASWSPKSRGITERVQAIAGQWGGQARVVAVNFQERPDEVAAFLRRNPWPVPVFLDTEGLFAKKYSVTTLPALLIFKEGRVVYAGKLPEEPGAVIREHL